MPRGRTKSKYKRSERIARAFECFAKGYTDTATAKEIGVTRQTAASYRRQYEERIAERARQNPNLLRDVLQNTMRSLEELDLIRADAWQHMKDRKIKESHECPECGYEWEERATIPVSDQTRAKYHDILLKSQDQRAKLFGILGVKQDLLIAITQVKTVQDAILRWMAEHLEGEMREALATFLETELREYVGGGGQAEALGVIDVEAIEERAS